MLQHFSLFSSSSIGAAAHAEAFMLHLARHRILVAAFTLQLSSDIFTIALKLPLAHRHIYCAGLAQALCKGAGRTW